MTGRCHHCRRKTMALPGAGVRSSRAFPPAGFQLGWVVEKADTSWLICYDCAHKKIVYAAA